MDTQTRVRRFDVSPLRSPQRLPDGRLRVEGFIARTGIQNYRDAGGNVRREYRPPDEVFHADAIASFADVPLTDNHPATGLITSKDARKVTVGYVAGHVRPDGDKLAASLTVIDADTAAKIEAGKRQLSCGYTCDYDPTPGTTPDGERYDGVQRNIRGNHVALVDVGRAGPDVALRMDGDAWVDEGERTDAWDAAKAARAAMVVANQKVAGKPVTVNPNGPPTGDSGRADGAPFTFTPDELRELAARADSAPVPPARAAMIEARAAMIQENRKTSLNNTAPAPRIDKVDAEKRAKDECERRETIDKMSRDRRAVWHDAFGGGGRGR